MSPKEKAKELFKSMYNKIFDIDMGENVMQDKKRFDVAKQCTLISVDEVLQTIEAGNPIESQWIYWNNVKTEIEKL